MLILPPQNPIGGARGYFDLLSSECSKYLEEIPLDFSGYDVLVDNYLSVSENDSDANYELSKSFNAWFEYFAELSNLIQNKYLDSEADKLMVSATKSILANDKNVSAGDRKANTDVDVMFARKKRNALKSLYDALVARQDFCEKAFYQCKHHCLNQFEQASNNSPGKGLG